MSTSTQQRPGTAKHGGGRLQPVTDGFNRIYNALPGWAWALILVAVGIIYGMIGEDLNSSLYEAMITTLAFVIMALGLNIVVGFAGLLDLGYVAFYAIGAFVAGWLMSSHFAEVNLHVFVNEARSNLPGLHVNFLFVLVLAAAFTALWGAILGFPSCRRVACSGSATSTSRTAARASRRSTSHGFRSRAWTASPPSRSSRSTSSRW
jgi:hypothetical protein